MKASSMLAVACLSLLVMLAMAAPPPQPKTPPEKAKNGKGVNVEIADAARLDKVITAQRGKVTLVNFWATWCSPCVAEFPTLLRLYNHYHTKDFTLLSVAVDVQTDRTSKVIPFLKKQNATFPAFIKATGDDAAFITAIDKAWEGSVPRTYLLDRTGRVRKLYTGELDAKEIEATVQKLLAEKPEVPPAPTPPTARPNGILGQ